VDESNRTENTRAHVLRSFSMSENRRGTTEGTVRNDEVILRCIQVRFETVQFIATFSRCSSIEYVGIQTIGNNPSDFTEIKATIAATLNNSNIRSRRRLSVIFKALKVCVRSISDRRVHSFTYSVLTLI
jgi:IMP cyclohydrolase